MSPDGSAEGPSEGDGQEPVEGDGQESAPGPRGISPDQPPPAREDSFAPPRGDRMHPALEPDGEHVAHSAIGSLVGGVLVWGGVGILLDHWLGTGRTLTALGVVTGFLTGFFIVYVRFGRDE